MCNLRTPQIFEISDQNELKWYCKYTFTEISSILFLEIGDLNCEHLAIARYIALLIQYCPVPIRDNKIQDCFLQKEARVCVSNAFVIENSQLNGGFFVAEDEQMTEEADMLMWIL